MIYKMKGENVLVEVEGCRCESNNPETFNILMEELLGTSNLELKDKDNPYSLVGHLNLLIYTCSGCGEQIKRISFYEPSDIREFPEVVLKHSFKGNKTCGDIGEKK